MFFSKAARWSASAHLFAASWPGGFVSVRIARADLFCHRFAVASCLVKPSTKVAFQIPAIAAISF